MGMMWQHGSMKEVSPAAHQLKLLRERAAVSTREMAGQLGMKLSSYIHYEDRYKKPYLAVDFAERIASILEIKGISREDVMRLAGVETTGTTLVPSDDTLTGNPSLVPVYDVQASAGHGSVVEYEPVVAHLALSQDYMRDVIGASDKDLKVIKVQGHSMEPTLNDDDLVMIDISKRDLSYDGLFVIRFGDSLQVKRIGRSPLQGHVEMISDNPQFGRRDWPIEQMVPVGRVLWVGKKV